MKEVQELYEMFVGGVGENANLDFANPKDGLDCFLIGMLVSSMKHWCARRRTEAEGPESKTLWHQRVIILEEYRLQCAIGNQINK